MRNGILIGLVILMVIAGGTVGYYDLITAKETASFQGVSYVTNDSVVQLEQFFVFNPNKGHISIVQPPINMSREGYVIANYSFGAPLANLSQYRSEGYIGGYADSYPMRIVIAFLVCLFSIIVLGFAFVLCLGIYDWFRVP
jgi:hypothetical protein